MRGVVIVGLKKLKMKGKNMSRLIDAVWLEEKLKNALDVIANDMSDAVLSDDEEIILAAKNQHSAYATVLTLLKHAPTIEATPVVHSRWELVAWHKGIKVCKCLNCNKTNLGNTPLCGHCGADMRNGGD